MTILEKIFVTKREEVAAAKARVSLEELKAQSRDLEPRRGFRQALIRQDQNPALIAEIKKGSPSAGTIRADFDPVAIAKTYEQSGADALSVLTDVQYFQGAPEYLGQIRKAVRLPLLRKDFIDDAYQLYEALVWGGDAVLLIVASLAPTQLQELYQEAKSIGLDVLVEVHDAEELAVALDAKADLIGVNNRDLRTFKTSLEVSTTLIPTYKDRAIAVSESALESHEDVCRVHGAGASAVLIGTAFTREADIASAVRNILRRGDQLVGADA